MSRDQNRHTIDPGWLDRPQDLRFLRQIGVDVVDVTLDIFPGYRESGQLRRESVQAVVEVVDGAGLKIERGEFHERLFARDFYG